MNEMSDCLGPAFARHRHAHHRYIHPKMHTLGVFRGQPFVLRIISEQPGISQIELSRLVHVQPPTLARTISRMQESGLVTRENDTSDHRIKRLTLTEQGKRIVQELKSVHKAEDREIFSVLSTAEQEQLCSLINRVTDQYERAIEESES